jgi:hypothetical protein
MVVTNRVFWAGVEHDLAKVVVKGSTAPVFAGRSATGRESSDSHSPGRR